MRDVRREFAAAALGVLLLRHVEGQDHRAQRLACRLDAADVELVFPAAALGAHLAVPAVIGRTDRHAEIVAAVDADEIPADRARVRSEDLLRCGIDAQNRLLVVEQDESLVHIRRDLHEFVRTLLQFGELMPDLLMLMLDAVEQGRKLGIRLVFERLFQIQLVERLDDAAREPMRQHRREHERQQQHEQDRLQNSKQHGADRRVAHGDAQHRAVVQPLGVVARFFRERFGIARALAAPGLQRLLHLLAPGVVFHRLGGGLRVAEHGAVGGDPRQAVAVGLDLLEIVLAVLLHRDGRQLQLIGELPLLNAAVVFIKHRQQQHGADEQNRRGNGEARSKNFTCHFRPPIDSPRRARCGSSRPRCRASGAGCGCAYPPCAIPRSNPCPRPR